MPPHMPAYTDKYFSLYKFIATALIFTVPSYSSASEYSVDDVIDLEKKLDKLKSEVLITQNSETNNYYKQNSALYHLKRKSWQQGLRSISPVNNNSTGEYHSYSNILLGISLQGMGRKDEALEHYTKIPDNSRYFATAQLNRALLYMHDGLSNKSLTIINNILTTPSIILSGETKNQISLILGYLYYQEKKYTESRNIFRMIEVGSKYSNRALLGIALDALHLKDYSSSQHVLSLLNNNTNYDLPADESFLIKAYSYQTQKKYDSATLAYSKATIHYEQRIKEINNLLKKNEPIAIEQILNDHIFILSNNKVDLSEEMPEIFFKNYKVLQQLLQTIKGYGGVNNNMHTRAISLSKKYNHIINKLLVKALSKRKTALSDYLKQSRYGQVISNDKLLSSVNKYND